MSSRNGGWGPSKNGGASDPLFKGKGTADISNPVVGHLQKGLPSKDMHTDDGRNVNEKKNQNMVQSNSSKQWPPQISNPKAWGQSDTVQRLGLRNPGGSGRGSGGMSSNPRGAAYGRGPARQPQPVEPDDESEDDDDELDDTDDELLSDGFDSDESTKSHETRKQNRWFKDFFQCLDACNNEQINDLERQWHCPACKGGTGAIDWYRGLLPLVTHAKTKKSKRVKLHQEFAVLLEEELKIRGTSAVPAGEMFGKWKGLEESDKEIVWPPMVIIMNTRLDKDENEKWIGMGNQELLEYFSAFSASRARHSYGPMGHRGMSALIFESSAVGYAEAERLSRHFQEIGRDRIAWDRTKTTLFSYGQRQLYGYMAEKQDLEIFNQHSQGKSKLKYEMRSYKEMVVNQLKQMNDENQKLVWYKNKALNEKMSKIALQDSFGALAEMLRHKTEESRIVKLRSQKHHEQNKQQMDFQEEFFREQIQELYEARNEKEEKLEKVLQTERDKVIQSEGKDDKIVKFIQMQDDKMDDYVKKREKLIKAQEDRKMDLQRRHHEEMMELEKEFDDEFNRLIEEYSPGNGELTN